MADVQADYDSPWKDILESYFEAFMAFFFPDAFADIDWQRGYEFLDKELQQVAREAEVGKRLADKLAKVWTTAGEQVWVLVHIEVQSQYAVNFAERMYTYNYRLRDHFNRPVASFAIFGDDSLSWRPKQFEDALWGCRTRFEYPIVKLLDYKEQWKELEASNNPFSVVVMAHLKTLETKGNYLERQQWKLRFVKALFQSGFNRQEIVDLLRFIDWLVVLPEDLEAGFWQDLLTYQEERRMKFVMPIERAAMEKGRKEAQEKLVLRQLEIKLGALSKADLERVRSLSIEQVEALGEALLGFETPSDLDSWLTQLEA